ncbi:VIT family OS=Tsukamurella paurometabola (strain ATCC 8368 / DSM / CCUG 35730 / CIP 100753 /JCM 10117 / KCTC 9821 / NBRC 16120 / NCIMB 702349 / NCTC 13040)OX=521096 GN=Tpau_2210 PE=4 SV=1 [Tsukamurella paurometabola]
MAEGIGGDRDTAPDDFHYEPHHDAVGGRLNWLRAGVLGANDGLISTAGIVIGVAAATGDSSAILTAGIARPRRRRRVDGIGRVRLGQYPAR